MKLMNTVRKIDIRTTIECVICFFAARLPFLDMNPVAAAMFLVAHEKNKYGKIICGAVYLGVLSLAEPRLTVKYTLIFMCILIVDRLLIKTGHGKKEYVIKAAAGIITAIVGAGGGMTGSADNIFYSVVEGVLVIVLYNIISVGMMVLDHVGNDPVLGEEQMISVVILLITAIGGVPEFLPDKISFAETGLYVLVLLMAFRYGAFAGAVAGSGAGIASVIHGNDPAFVGVFCIVGIGIGLMRDSGKWACLFIYAAAGVLIAMIFPDILWNVESLRAFAGALSVFICIPSSLLQKIFTADEEDTIVEHSYMEQAGRKLKDFSGAFNRLGEIYLKNCGMTSEYGGDKTNEMFRVVTQNVCSSCGNNDYCWDQKYYDTCHQTLVILEMAGMDGVIKKEKIPMEFAKKCIRFDDFMREILRQAELSRLNCLWENKLAFNRSLIAKQMIETGKLIDELEKDISIGERLKLPGEKELAGALGVLGIRVKGLAIVEKKNSQIEICMNAKTPGTCCVTFREAAGVISDILGGRWKAEDEYGTVIPREYKNIVFVKDERYNVLTGVARSKKNGEECSGDNYSFIKMPNGRLIMMIADGAGSGRIACDESGNVIEMIEELAMAGFREDIALSLVNSTLLYSRQDDIFSTVDFCVIDLNDGNCEFIKYGASSTFIRKNNDVRVIKNSDIPIGLIPGTEPECVSVRLRDSDMIIMLSDGVADCFPGEEKEDYIKSIILTAGTDNPNELAEKVLNSALGFGMGRADDDMSVLVAGIWEKNQ